MSDEIRRLWLDDMRQPPRAFTWVKTVQEAIAFVEAGPVEAMSLDHDLGACPDCLSGMTSDEWLERSNYQSMPNCQHFGTGYDFVCWMEENDKWPKRRPVVHSRNPVGRARMESAIAKRFDRFIRLSEKPSPHDHRI